MLTTPRGHHLGCIRHHPAPDPARTYAAPRELLAALPPRIDLTAKCPPIYDQGQLGSCVANAVGAGDEFVRMKEKKPIWTPSRLFLYYNGRVLENTVPTDSGLALADGILALEKFGCCDEQFWPYDIAKFAAPPPPEVYAVAKKHTTPPWLMVNNASLPQMKATLAQGWPFALGISVYASFDTAETARSGDIPYPDAGTELLLGGHAILVVGYDQAARRFRFRNSWGTAWGASGYGTIPYEFLTNVGLASDSWSCRKAA